MEAIKERETLNELAKVKGVRMGRKIGSVKSKEKKAEEYTHVIRSLKKGSQSETQPSSAMSALARSRESRENSYCNVILRQRFGTKEKILTFVA